MRLNAGKHCAEGSDSHIKEIVSISTITPIKAYVDFAATCADGALALIGWIFDPEHHVQGFAMLHESPSRLFRRKKHTVIPLKEGIDGVQLTRVSRPDVAQAMSMSNQQSSQDDRYGFILVAPRYRSDTKLVLSIDDGRYATLSFVALNNHAEIKSAMQQYWPHSGDCLLSALQTSLGNEHLLTQLAADLSASGSSVDFSSQLIACDHDYFLACYSHMPVMVERPETMFGTIDRSYPLGDNGLLIFGWKVMPNYQPKSVTLWNDKGTFIDISDRFTPLLRNDVAQIYRARFPQLDDWCGFVCLAPIPTYADEKRALCFNFGKLGEVWLKVPAEKQDKVGVDLIKEILGMVPAADRMRTKLYNLFNDGLGTAIEVVNQGRPPFNKNIEETRYGTPNKNADFSVIVPLYGRFDFLRHQLAHFVDDTDFGNVDLIYVVDDPSIVNQTLELAASYHSLFKLPFRVIAYGENRGFAGANNIGASLAHGNYLILLNSDIIPQHPGWLSTLRAALDTLPDAGAVGPLLNFYDGSIQHAGMRAKRDALLPGFLLNIHPGKGQIWQNDNKPCEQTLLTAACLMLKRDTYLEIGGLDEGYVIGDFEDSDLCLQLRKRGRRLWLVPESKLWHLERQSQNLESVVGVRQLITLFNGWRYHKKIEQGELPRPTEFEG